MAIDLTDRLTSTRDVLQLTADPKSRGCFPNLSGNVLRICRKY